MDLVRQARTAVVMVIVLTLIVGLLYPLAMTGLARIVFPGQANGSLLVNQHGSIVGSSLIGQKFSTPRYFHPRPSAAGENGYDAMSSGGSNLGPTNQKLIQEVDARARAYRLDNDLTANAPVPVDAVTASGSGLDPDISLANALLQVHRVAKARGLPESQVRQLVERHVEGRTLGILGEPRLNVLELNLALDTSSAR